MIATSDFPTALECTKFVFGWGSATDPTGGAYSAPPDHLASLRGHTFKRRWREGTGKGEKGGEEGDERDPVRKFPDPPLVGVANHKLVMITLS